MPAPGHSTARRLKKMPDWALSERLGAVLRGQLFLVRLEVIAER